MAPHEVIDSLGAHLEHLSIALIFPVEVHGETHCFHGPATPELSYDLQIWAILQQIAVNLCLLASSESQREEFLHDVFLREGFHVLD